MPALAALLTQQRYQAWKHWQTLQQQCLDAAHRNQFRLQLLQPKALTEALTPPSRKSSSPRRKTAAKAKHKRATATKAATKATSAAEPEQNGKSTQQPQPDAEA
ncbi:MAG: hypothetical protein AAF728_20870 [Cyanobacteria bacterium P01_D01_bin.128]